MEMLVAMVSGAAGAVAARALLQRRGAGLWVVTILGILGGAGAWWVLATIGPGEKAGPLLLWHIVAGMVGGAALAGLAALLWARAIR